ncbi:MAG: hypothetical protein KJO34_15920 [Deltaproteobacteria bacterium]|nr:hypothetical protein [Deltaproteobacteria bacterium]
MRQILLVFRAVILSVLVLFIVPFFAWAQSPVTIEVKTVLASSEGNNLDPQLSEMADELKNLFRYTSYRLLGSDRLTLKPHQTGELSLPSRRRLQITHRGIRNQRVELFLKMFKKRKNVFETNIRQNNRSSLIVGGPRYKNGYLLFSIYSTF